MGCFPSMEQWNDCLSGKRSTIRLRMLWKDPRAYFGMKKRADISTEYFTVMYSI